MAFKADVDVDVSPNFDRSMFSWTRASLVRDGKLTPHPVGLYPQAIPVDPVTKLAAIPYESAEELGYLKIDFLNLNVYSHFKTRAEIDALLLIEPNWVLLELESTHKKLFQLSNHSELLLETKPKNIQELADVMALIRPGKKQLLDLYKKNRAHGRMLLYAKDDTGYSFKKSHAIGYSYVVWLQLHLIDQGRL